MLKQLKEGIMTMSHPIGNTNKVVGTIKKEQLEILELDSIIIKT